MGGRCARVIGAAASVVVALAICVIVLAATASAAAETAQHPVAEFVGDLVKGLVGPLFAPAVALLMAAPILAWRKLRSWRESKGK